MSSFGYSSDGMQELYNNINLEIDNIIAQIKNAKQIVNKLDDKGYWTGAGFNNYEEKFNALSSNFGAYCNDLYVLNNTITSALNRYKVVDSKITKYCR